MVFALVGVFFSALSVPGLVASLLGSEFNFDKTQKVHLVPMDFARFQWWVAGSFLLVPCLMAAFVGLGVFSWLRWKAHTSRAFPLPPGPSEPEGR